MRATSVSIRRNVGEAEPAAMRENVENTQPALERTDGPCMTAPREIIPGRTYLITRRCAQRQYLLRPGEKTNRIFDYCLGEAAKRYGIELIAWLAMSNHYHAVVRDPTGRLPAFLEHFHKMVARALNVELERWENFWSTEETCVTYLASPSDIFDKVVYVLINPVAAHLVDAMIHWPGSSSLPFLDGNERLPERPRSFFRPGGRMPETAPLRAVQPPCSKQRESFEAWAARVRAAIAERERQATHLRAREGVRVQGRQAVLRLSPFDSPSTSTPRRNLKPALACKNENDRATLLLALLEFRRAYREARLLFENGTHDTEFPVGTYRFRLWGARCAPFPLAA